MGASEQGWVPKLGQVSSEVCTENLNHSLDPKATLPPLFSFFIFRVFLSWYFNLVLAHL